MVAGEKMAIIFTGGFISGGVSSGNIKGALKGGIFAAITYGVAHGGKEGIGWIKEGFGRSLTHASLAGVSAVIDDGNFGIGFTASFLSTYADKFALSDIDNFTGRIIANSLVAGTISEVTGGKFANGAMSAAFRVAFNEVAGGNSQKAARSKLSEYELDKFDYYYITSVDDIAGNVDGAISNTGFIEYVFGQSGRNIDQSNRYIYLQKYSVMVDLQHVVSASNNPFTSKAAGAAAGYWIEMIQSAKGQESAMQPEDLFSNKLGSYIGFRVSNNIEPSGTTIGLKVQQFIQNSSPVLNNNKALSIYSNQVKNQ